MNSFLCLTGSVPSAVRSVEHVELTIKIDKHNIYIYIIIVYDCKLYVFSRFIAFGALNLPTEPVCADGLRLSKRRARRALRAEKRLESFARRIMRRRKVPSNRTGLDLFRCGSWKTCGSCGPVQGLGPGVGHKDWRQHEKVWKFG